MEVRSRVSVPWHLWGRRELQGSTQREGGVQRVVYRTRGKGTRELGRASEDLGY